MQAGINRAANFAHARGLIAINEGKTFILTGEGKKVFANFSGNAEIFREESAFLALIKPYATEKNVASAMKVEDLLWA